MQLQHERFLISIRHSESDTVWSVFDSQNPDKATVEEFTLQRGYTYTHARAFADGMNRAMEWISQDNANGNE